MRNAPRSRRSACPGRAAAPAWLALVLAASAAAARPPEPAGFVPRGGLPPPVFGAPRALAEVSLDQAVQMAERRYRAKVVKVSVSEADGRRVYVLRLLSDEGRVWTVRVDAATGAMM